MFNLRLKLCKKHPKTLFGQGNGEGNKINWFYLASCRLSFFFGFGSRLWP